MSEQANGSQANLLPLRKQVFVAYSYKLYPKDDYFKPFKELERDYDVTFIFADEKITNIHIMKKIETFIRGSDFSIFDISGLEPQRDTGTRIRDGCERPVVYRHRSSQN